MFGYTPLGDDEGDATFPAGRRLAFDTNRGLLRDDTKT